MELKKRFDFRIVFLSLYMLAFLIYLLVGFLPAEAVNYKIDARLEIPAIGLVSEVTTLDLQERKLNAPDSIVGSYSRAENKTLLIGHSTTAFSSLDKLNLGEEIVYRNKVYRVAGRAMVEKNKISMREILKTEENDTLVLMTCAGELYEDRDASHRLIITAIEL